MTSEPAPGLPDVHPLVAELCSLPFAGSRRDDLSSARALSAAVGHPQNAVRTIHVAGTAGKGTVSAFVSAVLTAHGFVVGSNTSPHVYELNERIRLDGCPVPYEQLAESYGYLRGAIQAKAAVPLPSFFEAVTLLAFLHFARCGTDYNVVETGIGGTFDCTNIIDRVDKLAVVTRIGLDHTDILGPRTVDIARHKAGIFIPGGMAVSVAQERDVVEVLTEVARERRCALTFVLEPHRRSADVAVPGSYQRDNATVALQAVQSLAERDGWTMDRRRAIAAIESTSLAGRFERRTVNGCSIVLDGAHNPIKLAALRAALTDEFPGKKCAWVLAFRTGKDVQRAVETIAPAAAIVVATTWTDAFGIECVAPSAVASAAEASGLPTRVVDDPAAAVREAMATGLPVVVAGSFHLLQHVPR